MGSKIILAVLHINNAVPVVRIEHPLLGRIALNRTGRRPPASVKPLLSSVLGLLIALTGFHHYWQTGKCRSDILRFNCLDQLMRGGGPEEKSNFICISRRAQSINYECFDKGK